ncbi:hypothetical protein P12x_001040 [Tundrisphaera lichenicola]|uniref:hypothetical protein n=1 Tax=Tundrisphaera lichenicola TaxID=2029860 RepID=UPI003EBC21D1
MTSAIQIALTATPLAAYFYVLGLFHGGRKPIMLTGPVDVGLMAGGLGGLVAFGPFGQSVLSRVAGAEVGLLGWSIWIALVVLWSLVLAGTAALRVTVYHLSNEELDRAVRETLYRIDGRFTSTIYGFEDADRMSGITVRSLPRLRSATIEAYGKDPETLISEFKPRFREELSRFPQAPSEISHAMFGLACLIMLLPVTGYFLSNARAKHAFWALLQSLRWW